MKRFISFAILLIVAGTIWGQGPQKKHEAPNRPVKQALRKFQILVTNQSEASPILKYNDQLRALQLSSESKAARGVLGDLLKGAYKSSFAQKTVNASSNLLSLGISYLSEAVNPKQVREQWLRAARQQCNYQQCLSAETTIADFYALPSTKGALDPENLKFEGFGCRNYIELKDSPGEGVNVFFLFCKMRQDEEGLRYIVNHSKFLIELDSLMINPKYCNLPNDSTGSADSRFDFDKRDSLKLQFKVRLYSSWFNQAMMLFDNQQLGEFTINIKVDKRKLNADNIFVYDKNNPDFNKLVSIDGDCFLVPRSYTGTNDGQNYQPTWGTGQYRIEMDIAETCDIREEYYLIREAGNGWEVAYADATGGNKRWDKNKWKTEWTTMKARRKKASFFQNAWDCIISAYKGTSWVATLTDPFATSLYSYEVTKLKEWLKIPQTDVATTTAIATQKAAGAAGAAAASAATAAQAAAAAAVSAAEAAAAAKQNANTQLQTTETDDIPSATSAGK